jgi:hydrogenase nickel incorporation protein HypA/HybF
MHELSIALSILDMVAEQAARRHARIVAVRLKVGPLSGVVPSALESAYDLARQASATPDARLVIDPVPLTAYCPTCARECHPPSVQQLRCPACDTPTPDIVRGRELEVVALEVIDDARRPDAPARTGSPEGAQAE